MKSLDDMDKLLKTLTDQLNQLNDWSIDETLQVAILIVIY